MNSHMWAKPAVQRHVATLRADGVTVIEPQSGWLSCRQTGPGRMAEPDVIFEAIRLLLESRPAPTAAAQGPPPPAISTARPPAAEPDAPEMQAASPSRPATHAAPPPAPPTRTP
jgi:phosphopantothenoylcysteine decarboxylase/phosphopantothenate--cysteine ligase